MLGLGAISPNFSSATQASETKSSAVEIVKMTKDQLSGKALGDFAPYEPKLGNLVAKGVESFYSKDKNFSMGIWESKPGIMTYTDLEYDEFMYVLDGSMVMTSISGKVQTFTAGDGYILPKGWSGTLEVPEGGVRKIWAAYMGGKKGS